MGNVNIFCKRKKKNVCDFVNFWKTFLFYTRDLYLYPHSPEGEGGILFYLCPSVRPSVRPR